MTTKNAAQTEARLLPPDALASYLNVHPSTVRRLASSGAIPVVYIGSKLPRYDLNMVIQALSRRGRKAVANGR